MMGCLCSKGSGVDDAAVSTKNKSKSNQSSVSRREETEGLTSKSAEESKASGDPVVKRDGSTRKSVIIERPKNGHRHRRAITVDLCGRTKVANDPWGARGEQYAAGWPTWLSSVAGEAIQGLLPRSPESFEKIEKVGQGTYSSVYRARDLKTNKIVAMKKVKFVKKDPESVRFMAREISILRRLHHPNVIKLEAIVTSRISETLHLVFEYMEHDLTGLIASPKVTFTTSQIKCYMQQLFSGLQHCHDRGVLHRDIKGSNLLVGNNGILKIGDFGLATNFTPNQTDPLTSRVVTLWYRAPELLFGATEYGVGIDMWSSGCILAEMFARKPIMPGRTEVEQIHKIFKLCGSPSEDYWKISKLTHATSFKPHKKYKRCIPDTFKEFPHSVLALVDALLSIDPSDRGNATSALSSKFFKTRPLPCDPFSLPKYPPSKEFDAKFREEEAIRWNPDRREGNGAELTRVSSRQSNRIPSPEFEYQLQGKSCKKSYSIINYNPPEDGGRGSSMKPPKVRNGLSHSSSVSKDGSVGVFAPSSKGKVNSNQAVAPGRTSGSSESGGGSGGQGFQRPSTTSKELSNHASRVERGASQESMEYVSRRNRMHCSGPLVPPGGNMEDMLREHERQIQEAVRKSRLNRSRSRKTNPRGHVGFISTFSQFQWFGL